MDKKTMTESMDIMRKIKSLPKERQREMVKNLSKQEKIAYNEMNKQIGKIKSDEKRSIKRGGGGGAFTQFGASGKRGAEKMRKNPFELNKGGKVKFSRGGGVATQGTKFNRDG
jgi:hypothetical protein